jgi:hypothetical protein
MSSGVNRAIEMLLTRCENSRLDLQYLILYNQINNCITTNIYSKL